MTDVVCSDRRIDTRCSSSALEIALKIFRNFRPRPSPKIGTAPHVEAEAKEPMANSFGVLGKLYLTQSSGGLFPVKRSVIQFTAAIALAWAARPWPIPGNTTILTLLPALHNLSM